MVAKSLGQAEPEVSSGRWSFSGFKRRAPRKKGMLKG